MEVLCLTEKAFIKQKNIRRQRIWLFVMFWESKLKK